MTETPQDAVYARVHATLLSLPGAVAETPFGPDSLVFKVGGKMYAILYYDQRYVNLSLKVDPVEGEALRETWAAILPGYHLNKRHWITAILDGTLPDDLIDELIHDSYQLVVKGLTRAARESLSGTA
ncbi:MAG TPA: MmcQ/YjbR family DNA-binding protein [Thermomicrobiales bacterium]|nr:MmcQ/YjbR family DNA-binding protein [Thermomicrobiales bacterium]